MEDSVLHRVRLLLSNKKVPQLRIAEATGLKQNTFSRQINGESALSGAVISAIIEYFPDVSPEWLITGKGAMLKSEDLPLIKERLDHFLEAENISSTDFCKSIGLSIVEYKVLRGSLPESKLKNIIDAYPQLNIEWLVAGAGKMIKSDNPTPQISTSSGRPYYNVDFIGGFDVILNDQTTTPEYMIDFTPYNKDGVLWCNITGHSMEPEISNGDLIAIKEVHDWDKFITMNETYAIVTKNDLRTIKKVRKGSDKNHLLLVPVNKEYDDQEISKEMILRVFLVLGCMKRF